MSKATPYLEINDLVFLDQNQSLGVVVRRIVIPVGIDKRYLFQCRYVGEKGGLMPCPNKKCKNDYTCPICSRNVYAAVKVSRDEAIEFRLSGLISPSIAALAIQD
jgi:hypothetical protein